MKKIKYVRQNRTSVFSIDTSIQKDQKNLTRSHVLTYTIKKESIRKNL